MSFGSQRREAAEPAPGPGRWSPGRWGRGGRAALLAAVILLGGLGVVLGQFVAHQNDTISSLRTALHDTQRPAPVATPTELELPVASGSALLTVPDVTGGSLYLVAAAESPRPGSPPLTWLYVYDQHAKPGARYGLLEGICGGQFVTATDMAAGVANEAGDLTIIAPNLDINARAAGVWVLVYRYADGLTLGGVQGPLIGSGAKTFRSTPPC